MKSLSSELPVLTDCGLPGIKSIPFGVHMCSFYRTCEELAAELVPYFAAGMRNNERCIWITAAPLDAAAARVGLRDAGFDVDSAMRRGALVVRDFSDWYAEAGTLKGSEVIDLWLAKEERALAEGYSGLRITGNITFLRPQDWPLFMDYEALVTQAFRTRRIVTLCTYHLGSCGAAEVLDVMRSHDCTLDRPDEGWQILTSQGW